MNVPCWPPLGVQGAPTLSPSPTLYRRLPGGTYTFPCTFIPGRKACLRGGCPWALVGGGGGGVQSWEAGEWVGETPAPPPSMLLIGWLANGRDAKGQALWGWDRGELSSHCRPVLGACHGLGCKWEAPWDRSAVGRAGGCSCESCPCSLCCSPFLGSAQRKVSSHLPTSQQLLSPLLQRNYRIHPPL